MCCMHRSESQRKNGFGFISSNVCPHWSNWPADGRLSQLNGGLSHGSNSCLCLDRFLMKTFSIFKLQPKVSPNLTAMSSPSLAAKSLETWAEVAPHWDLSLGKDGNKYWTRPQEPCLRRFLEVKLAKARKGKVRRALEFATNNQTFARFLVGYGLDVLATDGTEQMLEIARGHLEKGTKIQFRKVDVTKGEELQSLIQDKVRNIFCLSEITWKEKSLLLDFKSAHVLDLARGMG